MKEHLSKMMVEALFAVRNRGWLSAVLAVAMAIIGMLEVSTPYGYLVKAVVMLIFAGSIVWLAVGTYDGPLMRYVRARNQLEKIGGEVLATDSGSVNEWKLL